MLECLDLFYLVLTTLVAFKLHSVVRGLQNLDFSPTRIKSLKLDPFSSSSLGNKQKFLAFRRNNLEEELRKGLSGFWAESFLWHSRFAQYRPILIPGTNCSKKIIKTQFNVFDVLVDIRRSRVFYLQVIAFARYTRKLLNLPSISQEV